MTYLLVIFVILILIGKLFDIYRLGDKKADKIKEEIIDYCKKNNLNYILELKRPSKIDSALRTASLIGAKELDFINVINGLKFGISFYVLNSKNSHIEKGIINSGYNDKYATICVLNKEKVQFPDFRIGIKNSLYNSILSLNDDFIKMSCKIAGKEEIEEVCFEDDTLFTEKFWLYGVDVKAIKVFFNKRVRDVFKNNLSENYYYETRDNYLIVSKNDNLDVNERLKMLSNALAIFSKLTDENVE